MSAAIAVVLSYLLGTIPWSLLAVRALRGLDLRRMGSGNLGATNVYRALGARAALPVLALDAAKGIVPVLVFARLPAAPPLGEAGFGTLCAVAAVVGHMFPFYLGFRGGKGIATSAGAFATLAPLAFLVTLGVFVVAFVLSGGIVSLGSLLGSLTLPVALAWLGTRSGHLDAVGLGIVAGLVVLVWIRHAANIDRLRHGTEKGLLRRGPTAVAPKPGGSGGGHA
jgi:acyl phosphate:glycerol-3-phosphate acyltransferase